MPFLIPLGMMAGGAIAGGLSNSEGARTARSSSTNTSTSTRNLMPFQQGLGDQLSTYSLDLMRNPSAAIDPIRKAGTQRINAGYAGLPQKLANKSLAFGGSQSGKFGKGLRMAEQSRLGDIGQYEGDIASLIMQQQNTGASLAERLLGQNFGSTVEGSSSGTQINPGSTAGGAVSGGLDALTTLLMLNSMAGGR